MSYPILEYDPAPAAMIEPGRVYAERDAPEAAVLCFFPEVIEQIREAGAREWVSMRYEAGRLVLYEIEHRGRRLAVVHPGMGSPLAAAILEITIAHGCRRFVACGGAGALVPELALGHVVVPASAVRDEGTSYHYLPGGREVDADPAGVRAAESALSEQRVPYVVGKTWTTDGLFRETPDRVARRRREGCLVVEMEAAALFAVARFRGVRLACLLYAGDSLAGDRWDHRAWTKHVGRQTLFWLAADAALGA